MPVTREVLGQLNCHVVRASDAQPPRLGVILCHGFGAPGTDLVPIGGELARFDPLLAEQAVFIFPEAPLSMEEYGLPFGRAWWPIDMLRLQRAIELGEFRDLRGDVPELLPMARDRLTATIAAVQERYRLAWSNLVLGGFSQGSMIATEVVLQAPDAPRGLIIWSGTLLNETRWTELAPHRAGLHVVQSHGTQDPILPFEAAEWLRDLLVASGLEVEFLPFAGGHTIPGPALLAAARLIRNALEAAGD